jgi:hypothetical protein
MCLCKEIDHKFSKLFRCPTLDFLGKWLKELFPCQISLRQHFSRELQFERFCSRQILHNLSLCATNVRPSVCVKDTSLASSSFQNLYERSDEPYPCWNAVVPPAMFVSLDGRWPPVQTWATVFWIRAVYVSTLFGLSSRSSVPSLHVSNFSKRLSDWASFV